MMTCLLFSLQSECEQRGESYWYSVTASVVTRIVENIEVCGTICHFKQKVPLDKMILLSKYYKQCIYSVYQCSTETRSRSTFPRCCLNAVVDLLVIDLEVIVAFLITDWTFSGCCVQLNIEDVHLRFEDDFSNPEKPFSFGVCINNVSAQNPSKEAVSIQCKWINTLQTGRFHIYFYYYNSIFCLFMKETSGYHRISPMQSYERLHQVYIFYFISIVIIVTNGWKTYSVCLWLQICGDVCLCVRSWRSELKKRFRFVELWLTQLFQTYHAVFVIALAQLK